MINIVKEEIAPGVVVYSNVIPNSENLYMDIEKDIISANLQWIPAAVKESSDEMINTETRDTKAIGIN
jgi:hypothetical protein